jgi:hypothetical protein
MNHYTYYYTNEVCYVKMSQTFLKVLFELLFSLTKLLNMVMVQNFAIFFGTKNELLCVELYNFMQCHTFNNNNNNQISH